MRFARIQRPPQGSAEAGHPDVAFAEVEGDQAHLLDGPPWAGGKRTGEGVPLVGPSAASLLCPVVPSKILCVGRNYAAHAKELGNDVPTEPLLFLKPPSALLAPGGVVRLPKVTSRVEHEAELGVIVGRRARDVSPDEGLACVFGWTVVGDITARDLQKKDGQWTRAKGFDTFCPAGPYVDTDTAVLSPGGARVRARVNGAPRQDGSTAQMVFDVGTLVSYASAVMTLEPGDLLVTGTPEGVGPLVDGDLLELEVSPTPQGARAAPAMVLQLQVRNA